MTHPPAGEDRRPVHAQLVSGAHLREAYDALGTLLSAMLVFGLPAWWLSETIDQVWVLPVGLVGGMAAAIGVIWVRYGVHGPEQHTARPSRAAASGPRTDTHPEARPDGG